MNFTLRPSKSFLFDLLEKKLSTLTGQVGLDAASADFKNRFMFKTEKYYGMDIRLNALEKGVSKNPDGQAIAIWADMTKIDSLPSNSVDVLVCTNAFQNFTPDSKIATHVISSLCRLTAPQGHLLVEFLLNDSFTTTLNVLKSTFKNIKIIYYKNPISQIYERIFETNTHLSNHKIAGSKPFRLFAWLLSRLEFLTCFWPLLNKHAFVICSGKRSPESKQEFNLSHLPKEDNIYKLIN